MTKNLRDELEDTILAGFSGIWLNTFEARDAMMVIAKLCKEHGWPLMTWDPEQRLIAAKEENAEAGIVDALNALLKVKLPDDASRGLLVIRNGTWTFSTAEGKIADMEILQALQRVIEVGESTGHHVIMLSYDHIRIPAELEKMVDKIDHPLPDSEELWQLAEKSGAKLPEQKSEEGKRIVNAVAGLSRIEASGAFALSRRHHDKLVPETLWQIKGKTIEKDGLLEMLTRAYFEAQDELHGFAAIAGLNGAKKFLLDMFNSPNLSSKVRPRGIVMVGPPGCGKSLLGKSLGEEIGRPAYRMDIGRLKGGIVGQTEANQRRAFATVDAGAPAVLVFDEVEKMLAGSSSGDHDSGVSAGILGGLLTWLNDHTSDVFPIFTANDIRGLPPELFRAERIDGVIFVDMPGEEQKEAAWKIYLKYYDLPAELKRPSADNWTPAEIKACCRQARMCNIDLTAAASRVVPIYNTFKGRLDELRAWASNNCLSAEYEGRYDANAKGKKPLAYADISSRPQRRVTSSSK